MMSDTFKADTLKELAEEVGVNYDVLRETFDQYNKFCLMGKTQISTKK